MNIDEAMIERIVGDVLKQLGAPSGHARADSTFSRVPTGRASSVPDPPVLSDRVIIMGARPGHVTDVIDIDLPRPRTEATRLDPRFVELTGRVWDRLRGMITADKEVAACCWTGPFARSSSLASACC